MPERYIPKSGRGPIGYAWTGHSAIIGWSPEQLAEFEIKRTARVQENLDAEVEDKAQAQ